MLLQKTREILVLGEQVGLGDVEPLNNVLQTYEDFLNKRKFLAGDIVTIAGNTIHFCHFLVNFIKTMFFKLPIKRNVYLFDFLRVEFW